MHRFLLFRIIRFLLPQKQQFFQIFYGLNRLFIRDKSAIHDIFLPEFLQLFFV